MTGQLAPGSTFDRRSLLRLGGAVAGTVAVSSVATACGSTTGARSGATTVKFWTVTDGPEDAAYQERMYAQFNDDHPDVHIELVTFPPQQFGNALQLAFTGGEDVPDVFRAGSGARLDDVYEKGWAAPLDEFLTEEFTSRFPDYCYVDTDRSPLYRGGHAYTVPRSDPFIHGQRPMYCNADLLEQAGASEPPRTWSEFAELAAKITKDGQGRAFGTSVVADNPAHWVMQCFAGPQPYDNYGPPPINLLDGTPMMSHPSMVATVDFWRQLVTDQVLTTGWESWKPDQAIQHMTSGRLAMYMFPLFHANELRKANPDLNLVLAAPPMPDDGRKGSLAQLSDVGQWFMSSTSQVKEAAWQVLDFLGSVEYQRGAFQELGQTSILPGVYEGIELDAHAVQLREMADELVRNRPDPTFREPAFPAFYADLGAKAPKPLPRELWFSGMTAGGYQAAAEKYDEELAATMATLVDEHGITTEAFTFGDWDPLQDYEQTD
ncbi:ABC transporter substrate-binding protein [Microlunatus sp. Y2014]|uniref:ABC transporter substrate-binding protein n=1 Tax=Microlunatus sp. Y2014 TaxID=3418488 RepID=UPI003DA72C82